MIYCTLYIVHCRSLSIKLFCSGREFRGAIDANIIYRHITTSSNYHYHYCYEVIIFHHYRAHNYFLTDNSRLVDADVYSHVRNQLILFYTLCFFQILFYSIIIFKFFRNINVQLNIYAC